MASKSDLAPDLLTLIEATDQAQVNIRNAGSKGGWKGLTPIEQARQILRALNARGWFLVEAETVNRARKVERLESDLAEARDALKITVEHIRSVEVLPDDDLVAQALDEAARRLTQAEHEEPFA